MSEATLKRWCEARDIYLGGNYPWRKSLEIDPTYNNEYTTSVLIFESEHNHKNELQCYSLEQQQLPNINMTSENFTDTLLNSNIQQIDQENQTMEENRKNNTSDSISTSQNNVYDDDDDAKTIISSNKSQNSAYEQFLMYFL